MNDLIHQKQTIMLGDCLVRMLEIPSGTIDVVVTSPPYNHSVKYNSYADDRPRGQYLQWLASVGTQLRRVLKPEGSLFLNVGSSSVDPWLAADVAAVFRQLFELQNHIIWVKSISIGGDTVGHFKPINSARYLNHTHEAIYHFTKTGAVPIDRLSVGVEFKDKSNISRRSHTQDKRCAGNCWFLPYPTVRSKAGKFNHPCGFPVELANRCIQLHGVTPGMSVLDPFVGAGSTLVAASGLGCSGFGIELDADYAQTALGRLRAAQEVAQVAEQVDDLSKITAAVNPLAGIGTAGGL